MITYIDEGFNVHIINSFMRFGIGKSIVDNSASGGLYVGIDHNTGKFKDKGYTAMKFGGNSYTSHPSSNYLFKNFKIPFYSEACQLVKEATYHIPNGFIGWDVAISTSGPTIIEANETPDLHMSDVSYDGLLRNPFFREIIRQE